MVELIPAISLVVHGRDIPEMSSERSRWHADYRQVLGLDPNRLPDGLVALDEIRTPRLLDAVVDQTSEAGAEYGWAPFLEGGFVLVVSGTVHCRPTCCVDLAEGVRDWNKVNGDWSTSWHPIESGHPGVLAKRVNDRLHISEQSDDFSMEIPTAIDVAIADIEQAARDGMRTVEQFANRLFERMLFRNIDQPHLRSRTVAGLDEHT